MSVIVLAALAAGATTAAALLTWRHVRRLTRRIRVLQVEAAAWQYRTRLYGNTLTRIRLLQCPPHTLADARRLAGEALDDLSYLEAAG